MENKLNRLFTALLENYKENADQRTKFNYGVIVANSPKCTPRGII